jgi:hypothetical protein
VADGSGGDDQDVRGAVSGVLLISALLVIARLDRATYRTGQPVARPRLVGPPVEPGDDSK